MSGASNFTEDALVLHFFRTGNMAAVSVLAIALVTTPATDANTGATITEVANSGAYERRNDANGGSGNTNPLDANWTATAGGDGQTDNANTLTFPTATGNWGNIQGIAIVNSATHGAGDMMFHGAVTTPKDVDTDDTAEFAIGAITVTFD